MSQFFVIHPETPQKRLLLQACDIIRAGGVVVYPTDTSYAIGCHIGDKGAVERIRKIRQLDARHLFTLLCRDLSDLSNYARVNNRVFRQLKAHTPGSFTFILEATKEVPRRLQLGKRKQIGLRVPDNRILLGLLSEFGEPLVSTTLKLPNEAYPLADPCDIRERLEHFVDLVIDGGYCGTSESTVIDLTAEVPQLIREGAGDFSDFISA